MFIYEILFYSLFMGLRETFRQNLIYYRKQAGLTDRKTPTGLIPEMEAKASSLA